MFVLGLLLGIVIGLLIFYGLATLLQYWQQQSDYEKLKKKLVNTQNELRDTQALVRQFFEEETRKTFSTN